MEEDFERKQSMVFANSMTYRNSTAFQRAMDYVATNDWALYCELICQEYDEAFGDE